VEEKLEPIKTSLFFSIRICKNTHKYLSASMATCFLLGSFCQAFNKAFISSGRFLPKYINDDDTAGY